MSEIALAKSVRRRRFRQFSWLAVSMTLVVAVALGRAHESPSDAQAKPLPANTSSDTSDAARAQRLEEFHRDYSLSDGQVLKRIAPPWLAGRQDYYQTDYAAQSLSIPEGPDYFHFKWTTPKPDGSHPDTAPQPGKLARSRIGWVGDQGPDLSWLVDALTGVRPYESLGDPDLMAIRVSGDWIIREGTADDARAEQLSLILRRDCQLKIRLRLVHEDRKVIVAEGNYSYRPRPGRGTVNYPEGTEEGNWLEGNYDEIDVLVRDRNDLWDDSSYTLPLFLERLSHSLGRPVLNEVAQPPMNPLIVHDNVKRNSEVFVPVEWNAEKQLTLLAEQTGLSFTERTRRVRVIHYERTD